MTPVARNPIEWIHHFDAGNFTRISSRKLRQDQSIILVPRGHQAGSENQKGSQFFKPRASNKNIYIIDDHLFKVAGNDVGFREKGVWMVFDSGHGSADSVMPSAGGRDIQTRCASGTGAAMRTDAPAAVGSAT